MRGTNDEIAMRDAGSSSSPPNVVAILVMAVTVIPVMIAQRLAGREATNRL